MSEVEQLFAVANIQYAYGSVKTHGQQSSPRTSTLLCAAKRTVAVGQRHQEKPRQQSSPRGSTLLYVTTVAVALGLAFVASFQSFDILVSASVSLLRPAKLLMSRSVDAGTSDDGRTLVLVRHAKSSWKFPELEDFDRPLSHRGEQEAQDLGRFLQDHDVKRPDIIFVSPSARTVATIGALGQFGKNVTIRFDRRLYDLALGEKGYLNYVQQLDARFRRVLLVGHNPAMVDLVESLTESGIQAYPTSTYCEIGWSEAVTDWSEAIHRSGKLMTFITPADTAK